MNIQSSFPEFSNERWESDVLKYKYRGLSPELFPHGGVLLVITARAAVPYYAS